MANRRRKRRLDKKATPPAKTEEQITHHSMHAEFSGPIPPPGALKGYEDIVPGSAERILKMAENDAEHQRGIEDKIVSVSSREARFGQVCGLVIGLAAFITCSVAIFKGAERTAMVIGGTTVVGLVTVFVTGRSKGEDS